jgi:endonuclease/exonuclease/phosphatase family metal-dependent hydrolase
MRLVLWNIGKGFRDDSRLPDDRRLTNARLALHDLEPDTVIINEADYYRPFHGEFTDYPRIFNLPYHQGDQYEGHMANCILSRHPIKCVQIFKQPNKRRTGLLVEVLDPAGSLFIATFHPYPNSLPETKARCLVQTAALARTKPCIIAADFNAVSPGDKVDQTALVAAFRRIAMDRAPEAVSKFIDGGKHVFAELNRHGYRDLVSAESRSHTIPTDYCNMNKDTAIRIDHILGNKLVRGHAWVVIHPQAEWASDHRPVAADIQVLTGASPR